MKIGIIGAGAIGRYVVAQALQRDYTVAALLLRDNSHRKLADEFAGIRHADSVATLPADLDHVIDCAGHSALREHGAEILRSGVDLSTVSIGALADQNLYDELQAAAEDGKSKLHLVSGAIGALDCLRAARIGTLESVAYVGRKPPQGWLGSPAETALDLANLTAGAATHFSGSARVAAIEYPKNANVAAAVAIAGIGFDQTKVELIADAEISDNIHEIQATGAFGRFEFQICGKSMPDNPRSSALAAMSVIASLEQQTRHIAF